VKETGIIMSGDHPRLILDGLKTMTRRTWGLGKINKDPDAWMLVAVFQDGLARFGKRDGSQELTVKCPYGGYGDRLWVRETWWTPPHNWNRNWREKYLPFELPEPEKNPALVSYKANLEPHQADRQIWCPSLFMPRWASRILLEITELRAERLQEVSYNDCYAEGIDKSLPDKRKLNDIVTQQVTPKTYFKELWDSLNAKRGYGWETNPWVWVISFRALQNT